MNTIMEQGNSVNILYHIFQLTFITSDKPFTLNT